MRLLNERRRLFIISFLILLVAFVASFFLKESSVLGTLSKHSQLSLSWTQADWSGSSGQTSWADSTKFSSSDSINTTEGGFFKLSTNSNWYDSNWLYRKKITFDSSSYTSDVVNIPIVVKLSSSNIGYNLTQDAGEDIRFTDSDGTTLLSYEIENWDEAGTSYVWVKVPQINSGTTTDSIYMYYGNLNATDAQNASDVWSNGYVGVWHLNRDPSETAPQMTDSVSTLHGTTQGSMSANDLVNGILGKALSLDGVDDYVEITDESSFDLTDSISIEAWVKPSSNLTTQVVASKGHQNEEARAYSLIYEGTPTNSWSYQINDGTSIHKALSNSDMTQNSWNYLVGQYDGSEVALYVNASKQTTTASFSGSVTTNDNPLTLGSADNGLVLFGFLSGELDDVRVSNVARSQSWISVQNDAANGILNTFASEEKIYTSSGSVISSIFDSGQASDWGTLSADLTTPSGTTVIIKARTGNSSDLSGATDFTSCDALTVGSDISSNSCITDEDRYIQYQVSLSTTDATQTPTVNSIDISYISSDPPPTISNVSSVASTTSAVVTWTTNEESSSQVEYGLTFAYGFSTTEINTSPRVTSHSVTLSSLLPCITYYYRANSKDSAENLTNGSRNEFTTKGCSVNATVSSTTVASISNSTGGSLNFLENNKGISLDIPANFADSDTSFQVNQLDQATLFSSIEKPSGKQNVGNYAYFMNALSSPSSKVSSFNQAITLTVKYDDGELGGLDETSLKLYKWDGSEWIVLDSCIVNTVENEVTCTTSSFSAVVLFAEGDSGTGAVQVQNNNNKGKASNTLLYIFIGLVVIAFIYDKKWGFNKKKS